MNQKIYEFTPNQIDGKKVSMSDYKGKVMLIVNVASQCGLTPQYEGLERIYEKYQPQGFEILGFPANDFGAQEPGSNSEIQDYCVSNFGVKFPMFEKIAVKGEAQHPLYQFLTNVKPEAQTQGPSFEEKLKNYGVIRAKKNDILWNFEKFLTNRNGEVIARFAPDIKPDDPMIIKAIEAAL